MDHSINHSFDHPSVHPATNEPTAKHKKLNKAVEDADLALALDSSTEDAREQARVRLLATYEDIVRQIKVTCWREFQEGVTINGGDAFFAKA